MAASTSTSTSWEDLPFETMVDITSYLGPKDLKAVAASCMKHYTLRHDPFLARIRERRLCARQFSWSISGPELAEYALRFFDLFPHLSTAKIRAAARESLMSYPHDGSAFIQDASTPRARRCVRERWIPPNGRLSGAVGEESVLLRAVQSGDIASARLLLAAGVEPAEEALDEAVSQQRLDHIKALLDAGASPNLAHIQQGYQQRRTDRGRMFVTLLEGAFISIKVTDLDNGLNDNIQCISTRPPLTYLRCILKFDEFVGEVQRLLSSEVLDSNVPEEIEVLSRLVTAGSPLSPALYRILTHGYSESVTYALAQFLLEKGARRTPHVIEGVLSTGSERCITLILEQEGVSVSSWMLERAIVVLGSQPALLQKITARCPNPSELALELAVQHAPYLVHGLLKKLPRHRSRRVVVKAIYYLKKENWPQRWSTQALSFDRTSRPQFLELACLWQPENLVLIEGLRQGLSNISRSVRRSAFRALRLNQSELLKRLLSQKDLETGLRGVLIGKVYGAVSAAETFKQAGIKFNQDHLVRVLKEKPLKNDLIQYLLEEGTPVNSENFAKVAKIGSSGAIAAFRQRGFRPTRHILEHAFRRVPFDPEIVRALIKGEEAKWHTSCQELANFPLVRLFNRESSVDVADEILKVASLFCPSNNQAGRAKVKSRQKGKEKVGVPRRVTKSHKGKEKINFARQNQAKGSVVNAPSRQPELLIRSLLRYFPFWSDQTIKSVLSNPSIGSDHRLFQYPARESKPDTQLIRKLVDCGLKIDDRACRFVISHQLGSVLELLLNMEKFPSAELVYELFKNPSGTAGEKAISGLLAASGISSEFQGKIIHYVMCHESMECLEPEQYLTTVEDREDRARRLGLIKQLISKGVKPTMENLVGATKLPVDIADSVLKMLLSVWQEPLSPDVILSLALREGERAESLINYTRLQFCARGNAEEDLLIAAVGKGDGESLQGFTRLLELGIKPTEGVLLQALTSHSLLATEFVEQLLIHQAPLTQACFDAIPRCESPQVAQVAAKLFAHPDRPTILSSDWLLQLLGNPSPAMGQLLETFLKSGVRVEGLNEDAFRKALQSNLDSSAGIVQALLKQFKTDDALELAAANAAQGPKLVTVLLSHGYTVTKSVFWAARCNRETMDILFDWLTGAPKIKREE